MPTATAPPTARPDTDAVIVGAGMSGLYQLLKLRELGLRTVVFEAGDDIGGTWYWNRYPGARCDIESMTYSYSFSPELDQEWVWSERYAGQPEILRYLHHVADRFALRPDITLRTRVTRAVYDGAARWWVVSTDTGQRLTTRFLIMASGCSTVPKGPEVPGVGEFAGPVHHTARWPREGMEFAGRRVAVIGTGASGVQCVPLIARQAAELTVFQRTPVYALPALNRPLTDAEVTARKAEYPQFRAAQRRSKGGSVFAAPTRSALEVTAEERHARYEAAWSEGVLSAVLRSYTDLLADARANETAAEFVRGKIRSTVADPATAELLSPRTYPFGTKRPCLDTGYYATFNLPHVRLVDLGSAPLVEITAKGVRTTEEEHPADVLVLATGFDSMTGALTTIDLVGRDGVTLREKWARGPVTYLGLACAGFPNLFTVTGPLSPSVLTNMAVSIEQHVEWITDCVRSLRDGELTEIEATVEAEQAWVAHAAEVAGRTLYPTAESWYTGANVPGKPRGFLAYLGGADVYRERCDAVARDGYAGFTVH
ncbi:NAD(P)-binding domain-containing protein [Streptomyces sp. NPDC005955]|uniref:flavin-containing monooxygenase n=1 Tax=Streptomyces sp. NPDC005955 TaxID=3364738 RepID=UPI0036BD12AF